MRTFVIPFFISGPDSALAKIRFYQCCGSRIFIPDPGAKFFHPGSRIRIKEFKYLNPKIWFLSTRKWASGCSSRIWIPDPDPDPDLLPIPDPGVKKAPDPQYWFLRFPFRNSDQRGGKELLSLPGNDGRCRSPWRRGSCCVRAPCR